jgi:hypothetical protein
MEMLKIQEKVMTLSDEELKDIYSLTSKLNMESIEELAPALFRICLNAEKGELKNELGRVIFHLQKTERLSTRIGVQKLLEGALKVNAAEAFKLLETSEPDAKELAQEIKAMLK